MTTASAVYRMHERNRTGQTPSARQRAFGRHPYDPMNSLMMLIHPVYSRYTMRKESEMKKRQTNNRRGYQDSTYQVNEKIYDRSEMFGDKTEQKRKQCKKYLKYVGMYLGAFILGMLARFFIGICAKL